MKKLFNLIAATGFIAAAASPAPAYAVSAWDFAGLRSTGQDMMHFAILQPEAYRSASTGQAGRAVCIRDNFILVPMDNPTPAFAKLVHEINMEKDRNVQVETIIVRNINEKCGGEGATLGDGNKYTTGDESFRMNDFFSYYPKPDARRIVLSITIATQIERAKQAGNLDYSNCIKKNFDINAENGAVLPPPGAVELIQTIVSRRESTDPFHKPIIDTIVKYCGVEQKPVLAKAGNKEAQAQIPMPSIKGFVPN